MAAAEALCSQQTSRECVYAFGGQAANFTILATAMRYDPQGNAWSFVVPMATSRDNLAGSAGPAPAIPGMRAFTRWAVQARPIPQPRRATLRNRHTMLDSCNRFATIATGA